MSCPSVCPRVSARLPLDGFPRNLILEPFTKICWKSNDSVKMTTRSKYVLSLPAALNLRKVKWYLAVRICEEVQILCERAKVWCYTTVPVSLNIKVFVVHIVFNWVGRFRIGFPLYSKYLPVSLPTYYCSSCAVLVAARSCTTRKGGLHGSVKTFWSHPQSL